MIENLLECIEKAVAKIEIYYFNFSNFTSYFNYFSKQFNLIVCD
jgi:hypothetical protein